MHYSYRPDEEIWVKEGIAHIGEYIVLKRISKVLFASLELPETSLVKDVSPDFESYSNREQVLSQYGHILQYFYYIYRLCGGRKLIDKLLTSESKLKGVAFLNYIFSYMKNDLKVEMNSVCKNFNESFFTFQQARFFPNPSPQDSYVLAGNFFSRKRENKLIILPEFSAQAFKISEETECINGNMIGEYCLEIQTEKGNFLFQNQN